MGWQLERHSEGNATLCGRRWLDAHFAARAQSCEQAVRSIGIEPGWSVLDAGCGTGPFLPWLGELVGASGKLNALDIAADHVAYVQRLGEELPCELIATRGSITELPFPDRSFDAVWTSYTSEYLTDDDLRVALRELARVTKPGGIVAILDNDSLPFRIHPIDMRLVWRFFEAASKTDDPIAQLVHGELRIATMRRWLESEGFVSVRQHTYLTELWAPLGPEQRAWVEIGLDFFSSYDRIGLAPDDVRAWSELCDPTRPTFLPDNPQFYWCEASTLAVGRVAER